MRSLCFIFIIILFAGWCSSFQASVIGGEEEVSYTNLNTSNYTTKPESCLEIKSADPSSTSGLFTIYSKYGEPYSVYCEMESVGGGWTLVASIHDNNYIYGKCTAGDRWSSENGVKRRYNYGESNWENVNTFGNPEYAASDDYKNRGYFEIQAKRFMLIQVPNGTPMEEFVSAAKFQSYTPSSFLQSYGGNFRELFKRYPIYDGAYTFDTANGPSVQMSFIKGDPTSAHDQYQTSGQEQTESGYVQFRAVGEGTNRPATSFCPYGKMRPGKGAVWYTCFGMSYPYNAEAYCGDFSYFQISSLYQSAFLILYR